jgi:hypothetical protein
MIQAQCFKLKWLLAVAASIAKLLHLCRGILTCVGSFVGIGQRCSTPSFCSSSSHLLLRCVLRPSPVLGRFNDPLFSMAKIATPVASLNLLFVGLIVKLFGLLVLIAFSIFLHAADALSSLRVTQGFASSLVIVRVLAESAKVKLLCAGFSYFAEARAILFPPAINASSTLDMPKTLPAIFPLMPKLAKLAKPILGHVNTGIVTTHECISQCSPYYFSERCCIMNKDTNKIANAVA